HCTLFVSWAKAMIQRNPNQMEPRADAVDAASLAFDGSDDVGARESNQPTRGGPSRLERRLLRQLIGAAGSPPVAVRLWSGELFAPVSGPLVGTLQIDSRAALWRL